MSIICAFKSNISAKTNIRINTLDDNNQNQKMVRETEKKREITLANICDDMTLGNAYKQQIATQVPQHFPLLYRHDNNERDK